jgi:hypothetical protein
MLRGATRRADDDTSFEFGVTKRYELGTRHRSMHAKRRASILQSDSTSGVRWDPKELEEILTGIFLGCNGTGRKQSTLL